jgi:hypothetical protein
VPLPTASYPQYPPLIHLCLAILISGISGIENTGAGAGATIVISQVTGENEDVPPYFTSWHSDYHI